MRRFFTINSVVLILFVSLLTNGFTAAMYGEIFMHESNHCHQHSPSVEEITHGEYPHNRLAEEENLDLSVHTCFNTVYLPLLLTKLPLLPTVDGKETLAQFIYFQIPESTPDSPFHPPRTLPS